MIGRIVRAPFRARTWREYGYVLLSVFIAVPAFLLALVGVLFAALSLVAVGLPLLIAVLFLARGLPRYFRGPARALLGWSWSTPSPLRAAGFIDGCKALLRDGTGWRALLYAFIKFPLMLAAGYLGGCLLVVGLLAVTYPLWWFGTHGGFGLMDDAAWSATLPLAIQGLLALLVFPWFIRLLVWFDRLAVHGLLELIPGQARIAALESSRDQLQADAVAQLRRVERDLHDGTQARLVGLGVSLGRIERRTTDSEIQALAAGAVHEVAEALTELREIVRGMHPPILDAGLPAALDTLAARYEVPVELDVDLPERPSDALASAIYFTVAELLTNVARHARASRAQVSLTATRSQLRVEVYDDGVGGAKPSTDTSGLAGLSKRAIALDGSLRIDSPSGGPTRVVVHLPKEG